MDKVCNQRVKIKSGGCAVVHMHCRIECISVEGGEFGITERGILHIECEY